MALDLDDTGAGSVERGDFSAAPLVSEDAGKPVQNEGPVGVLQQWSSAIANDDTQVLSSLFQYHDTPTELIDVRSKNGKSALMVACKTGDAELARQLVAEGADTNAVTSTGGTPFMFAALGNHQRIAQWLFDQGVDIDAQGSNGWSAVTIASAKGLDEMLGWLASIGADVNAPDVYQFSPLMRAVDNGHTESVMILLSTTGIAIDVQDEANNTALHYAVANNRPDLVAVLLESGARSDIPNRLGKTAATMARDEAALSVLFPIQ